jgi:ribosomal protein S9
MCEVNPEPILKPEGLLTRDVRMVERKKFGQKKARKKFQLINGLS